MISKLKFPSAYTILFGLIIVVAIATWFVPAGQYERQLSEALGKEVPVSGTYREVEPNPQGFVDVVLAPIAGFFDPHTYEARANDVSLFVLIIGGFLGVVTRTGAIDAGIARTMVRLKGQEKWMIPILMALFAAGGTVYGMAEETLAFYPLIIPLMLAARYDALTGVAMSGIVNLIVPTSAVVMGGLALGRVPYERWLRFMWPLLVILAAIILAALGVSSFLD